MFKFRDYNCEGEMYTFYTAEEPAFLVGLKSEARLKYGEYDELVPLMNDYSRIEPVAVIRLPKNQEEIDKLFQSTGLTQRLIKEFKKNAKTE